MTGGAGVGQQNVGCRGADEGLPSHRHGNARTQTHSLSLRRGPLAVLVPPGVLTMPGPPGGLTVHLQSPLRSADVLSVTALSASQRVTRGRRRGSALMRGRWTTRADPPTEGGQNQRESESGEA